MCYKRTQWTAAIKNYIVSNMHFKSYKQLQQQFNSLKLWIYQCFIKIQLAAAINDNNKMSWTHHLQS